MPRAIDLRGAARITHDPTQRIDTAIGKLPPFDLQQIIDGFLTALKDLTGIDLTGIRDFLENLFGTIDWSDLPTPEEVWHTVVTTFINPLIDVAEAVANALLNAPLNAANLVGSIVHLLTQVPFGALSSATPNLLPAPRFAVGSIAGGGSWSVDPGMSRSVDGSGAAKVIADGSLQALRSGRNPLDTISVGVGQRFSGSVFVAYEGYVGAGASVLLQLVPFTEAGAQAPVELASFVPVVGDLAWPGFELVGTWDVPEGVVGVQQRIVVTEAATAGVFFFDDANVKQSGKLRQEWVDGLPESLQEQVARWQLIVDTVHNSLTGATSVLNSIEDLAVALLNIPFGNIIGTGGPANIGESVMAVINQLVGGLVGQPGDGAGLADVFNVAKLVSSWASQGANAWEILGIRNNSPVANGLLATGDSNFPYANANTYLAVTQSASLAVTHRVGKSAPLGVVSWLGYGNTGVTGFYVNVRKIDAATGARVLVHHSANLVGVLAPGSTAADAAWHFYDLPTPLPRVAGEDYEYQLVPVGGTHNVRGLSYADDVPDHPYSQVKSLGAVRNETSPTSPASSISKASVVSSPDVMWIETAIDTGNTADEHDPVTVYLTESTTIPIPNWANHVDAVVVGGGGAGHQGGTVGIQGENGAAGKFAAVTWHRGEEFTGTETIVTFVRGDGGDGGTGDGGDGGDSSLGITGFSVTGDGGAGGDNVRIGGHIPAPGPGEFTYNGETFVGGGDQNAYGGKGTSPGGAGAGGNWLSFQFGGDGGDGAGWVRFRKDPIDGEVDSGDTTPPTAPALSVDASTFSTLTVTATGATDD